MKKHILLLALFISSIALHSCNQKENEAKEEACATTQVNPNGESELALMMRDMAKLSEANAIALREGKELAPYKGEFSAMLKAERTMHDIDEDFYQGMAKSYLNNIDKLYAAPASERITLHNNMIESCQACHNQICPGPLKRIDKMLVNL